jgi:three-Cys-motif partner protein
MPDETIWELPPQTAAKHTLLREYLKAWYPIMAQRERRVGYIDGFAGPGRYRSGEPGSPLVALETLLDHTALSTFHCDFVFKFIEADGARAAELERSISSLVAVRGGFPSNLHWSVETTTFAESTRSFLDSLDPQRRLIPALALIDPFGFKGASMSQITDLLRWDKCEVLFNFMFDSVNRWATSNVNDRVLAEFDALFGTSEYRNAPATGLPRKEFLLELYKRQLREVAKFRYVRSFEMINNRGHTGNYMVFGTRNTVGLSRMKQAMWKVDPEHGTRFAVPIREGGQTAFDFGSEASLVPLRGALLERFAGTTVSIEQIETFVLTETDFLEKSHLKRRMLTPLQAEGLITNVTGQRTRGQFPKRCAITFATVDQ